MKPTPEVLRLLTPYVKRTGAPTTDAQREIRAEWLVHFADEYRRTANPVHAWNAIHECLTSDLPIPEWVRLYLLDGSSALKRLAYERPPGKDQVAPAVAKALGFRGRGAGNPFSRATKDAHEYLIARDVYTCYVENRKKHDDGSEATHDWGTLFNTAADRHAQTCKRCTRRLSGYTVGGYWRKHAMTIIPRWIREHSNSQKIDDLLP